jgi:hypothetical protein
MDLLFGERFAQTGWVLVMSIAAKNAPVHVNNVIAMVLRPDIVELGAIFAKPKFIDVRNDQPLASFIYFKILNGRPIVLFLFVFFQINSATAKGFYTIYVEQFCY